MPDDIVRLERMARFELDGGRNLVLAELSRQRIDGAGSNCRMVMRGSRLRQRLRRGNPVRRAEALAEAASPRMTIQ